jgi:hypothetical protein
MSALNTVVISTASGGFTCTSADIDAGDFVTISGTFGNTGTGSIAGYANPTTYKVSAVAGDAFARTGFTLTTSAGVALVTITGTPTGLTYIKIPPTPKASVKPKIKLGFDRIPAPVTKQLTQLVDIEGSPLFTSAGTPLVTDEEVTLSSFARSSGATSVYVNNMSNTPPISIPVIEQFPETSAVSNSLLGVPRAETSLSLFSDVSTYGIDEENWTYQTYASSQQPPEWHNRKNAVYGNRTNPKFYEETGEQALYLKSFPVQYGFPGSPLGLNETSADENVLKYINFVAMGRYLYEKFKDSNIEFAKRNFLNENIYPINIDEVEVAIEFISSVPTFSNVDKFLDVEYGDDVEDSLFQVERWTIAYQRILDGVFEFPSGVISTDDIDKIKAFLSTQAIPGDPNPRENFAILESVKTFRYQPGRVSGFTFGTRQQTDPSSSANYIEWGCSNDTDEYMFQLRGSTFNIVRRSTIPFTESLLLRQGLRTSDQSAAPIKPVGVTDRPALYETIIPRTLFNGDSLLGNGPSGYILSFEDVTMYKIEFSWYGAVGAKFYAYVPANVGDARWVLMHTLVIENGLGKPILNNPDFKFKYLVYSSDHTGIDLPLYIYKYGSSYYIDGGDEGTITLSTVSSETKTFSSRTPIIGVMPKEKLINRDGIGIVNYKKGFPSLLSVNSSKRARIDIEYITGSPDGVHFSHAPSLHHSGTHINTTENLIFRLNITGTEVDILNGKEKIQDYNGKIIADGVYNVYAGNDQETSTNNTYSILRRGLIGQGQGTIAPGQDRKDQYSLRAANFIRGLKSDGTYVSRKQTTTNVTSGNFVQGTVYEITDLGIASPGQSTQIDAAQVIWNTVAGTTNTLATAFVIGTQYNIDVIGGTTPAQWHTAAGTQSTNASGANYHANYVVGDTFTAVAVGAGSGKANVVYAVGNGFKANAAGTGTGKAKTGEQYFSGKIANFHAVASSVVPIYGNDFKIHFLDPSKGWGGPRQRTGTFGHYADYAICLGPYAPKISDPGSNLVFEKDGSEVAFNFDDVIHVTGSHLTATLRIKDRADFVENDPAYGQILTVDTRIPAPIPNGNNADDSGRICAVIGEVRSVDYPVKAFAETSSGSGIYKITFTASFPTTDLFTLDSNGNVLAQSAEIGIQGVGTGKYFTTLPVQEPIDTSNPTAIPPYSILASGNPFEGTTFVTNVSSVQTKIITIKDGWKLDPDRFFTARFSISKAVKFNAQPLYLTIAMHNDARVNSIVVEEITADSVSVKTPSFITAESGATLGASGITLGGQAITGGSPSSAFNSSNRSSGLRFDTQLLNPLRKGTVIHSLFVDANKPMQFDLSNIFGIDRKTLARGMINNTATYFTANTLDSSTGQIEMTLTAKEQ